MTVAKLTQDSLIEALRALRKTHPGLPAADWQIGEYAQELRGTVGPSATVVVLSAYAEEFGGEIVPRHRYFYKPGGVQTEMQTFELSTTWADVPIVLTGSLPVSVLAVA